MTSGRRWWWWLALLGACAVVVVLVSREGPPVVTVHTVSRGAIEATVANTRAGTVTANRRARLAPNLGGLIARLPIHEGDRVTAGQQLVELWHEDLDAELALAASERERAAASATEARLRAELAERDAQRQQDLHDIASQSEVDRLRSTAAAARAAEQAAVAAATSAARQVDVITARIRRLVVTAPFAGIVAEVNGEVGEYATPSPIGIPTPPVVDLIDDAPPYVLAPIDEVDAARVQVGMAARITLDAFGKRTFAGRVQRIAPYVLDREKQARTVDVEVVFAEPPPAGLLLPGYSADVEIVVAQKHDVLVVPSECLQEGQVWLVGDDGVLVRREVTIGLASWRRSEITDGLRGGERLVAGGDVALAAGLRVRVAAAPSSGSGPP